MASPWDIESLEGRMMLSSSIMQSDPTYVAFEAETPLALYTSTDWKVINTFPAGSVSGTGAVQAIGAADTASPPTATENITFPLHFSTSGTYRLYIRDAYSTATSGDNSVWVAPSGSDVATTPSVAFDNQNDTPGLSHWHTTGANSNFVYNVNSGFDTTLTLNVREQGFTIDRIVLSTNLNLTPAQLDALANSPLNLDAPIANATPGDNSVALNWQAVPGADSYVVKRDGTTLGTTTNLFFVDKTAVNGASYNYTVSSKSGTNVGPDSPPAFANPTAPFSAPANPSTLISGSSGSIVLNWTPVFSASSYDVLRSTSSGTETFYKNVTDPQLIDNVAPGTTYYYTVVAKNSLGSSFPSGELSSQAASVGTGTGLRGTYRFGPGNRDFTGPIAHSQIDPEVDKNYMNNAPLFMNSNTFTEDNFSVRWNGLIQAQYSETYTLHLQGDDGVRLYIDGALVIDKFIDQGPTDYTWTTPTPWVAGSKHAIQIDYYENGGGADAELKWESASTPLDPITGLPQFVPASQLYEAPATPSIIRIAPGNGEITLNIAGLDNTTGINLYRSTTPGTGYTLVNTGGPLSNTTSTYVDTGLTNGTTYYYIVKGINGLGEGPASAEVNATPSATAVPIAPFNLRANTTGATQITLNWNGVPYTTDYTVLRSNTSGTGYAVIASGVTGTTYADNTAVPGSTYYYVVEAHNANGNGPNSNEVKILVGQGAVRGNYFPTSVGNEPLPFGNPTVVRLDPGINFDSGRGVWTPAGFNGGSTDNFTVRWTGQVLADTDGSYTFFGNSDDASYIWVDNQLVSSYPQGHGLGNAEATTPINLTAGWHNIIVDMGEGGGGYGMIVSWSTPAGAVNQVIPADHFLDVMTPAAAPTNVVASDNSGNSAIVTLTYTDNSGSEIGYMLQRSADNGSTWVTVNSSDVPNITTISDPNPLLNIAVQYRVVGFNYDNTGIPSAAVPFTHTLVAAPTGATGLLGHYYYHTNKATPNEPEITGNPEFVRLDSQVNFTAGHWEPFGVVKPLDDGGNADRFSVRWTGQVKIDADGTYTFFGNSDDASYVWVDDKLVSSYPGGHGMGNAEVTTPIILTAGLHNIVMDYAEGGGGYGATLSWTTPAGATNALIPSDHLLPHEGAIAAPTNFAANPADVTVQLAWNDEANHAELGYRVEVATQSNFSDAKVVADLPKDTTTYLVTGLTKATPYFFRLTPHNYEGDGPSVTLSTSTTDPQPPADPTNFYARAGNNDRAILTWTDNANNETHYIVQREDVTAGGSFSNIATLNPDTVTYTDADAALVIGHTYSYRVIATNENATPALSSNPSNESSIVTVTNTIPAPWADGDIGAVGFPGSAEYDVKADKFYVSASGDDIWNAADAEHYVYQQLTGNVMITARTLMTYGPDAWTKAGVQIRNDLTPGSQNATMVISRDNGYASQIRATAGGASTQANVGLSSAQPVWLRLVRLGDNFTGFVSTDGVNYTLAWQTNQVFMSPTVYVGLALTAHNNAANPIATAQYDNVVAQAIPAPEAPTNVQVAAVTSTDMRISWKDNSLFESGFRVERATQANFSDAVLIGTESANQTLLVDHNLTPNTTYYYRVTGFNDAGNSTGGTGSGKTFASNPGASYVGDVNSLTSGWQINSPSGSTLPVLDSVDPNNVALQLTSNTGNQTGSVFTSSKVDLSNFHVGFDLQMNPGAVADGMTFAIIGDNSQNHDNATPPNVISSGNQSIGGGGGSLGYASYSVTAGTGLTTNYSGITNSAALKFDIYNNIDKTDLLLNGNQPDTEGGFDVRPSGIQFRSGDPIHVDVYYNGTFKALTEVITDLSTGAGFAHIYNVDLGSVIGASQGYVGWTGATGGASAQQMIRDAEYDQFPLPSASVSGTNATGNIYISGTGANTSFWINHDPTSTPADLVKPVGTQFVLDAKGGTVTIDVSNGQPISPLGMALSNVGTLRVIGTTGNDSISGVNGALLLNGGTGLIVAPGAVGGIQFVGNGGSDSYVFTGGNYNLTSDLGAGGTTATLRVSNDSQIGLGSAQHIQTLSAANTSQVNVDHTRGHTLVIGGTLTLADTATLDLNENDLVLSNPAALTFTNDVQPNSPITGLTNTVAGGPSVVAAASDMPAAEGVAHAIDGQIQKYLNFGTSQGTTAGLNTGFFVTPTGGSSVVNAIRLFTANDGPERDPASYTLEGTTGDPNDPNTTWQPISSGALALPATRNGAGATPVDASTMANQLVSFANSAAYTSYRVLFPTTKGPGQNSMQIGEVQLLTGISTELTIQGYINNGVNNVAGPRIIASSANDASSVFKRTLAVADNNNLQFASFSGETFPAGNFNQILVKYTYFGDSNLDGQVTPNDYAIVDGNIGSSHDWGKGDLNGDGNTTPADYALIDGNIGAGNGTQTGGPQLNAVASSDNGSGGSSSSSSSGSNAVVANAATTQPAANASVFSTTAIHDNSDLFGSDNASVLA